MGRQETGGQAYEGRARGAGDYINDFSQPASAAREPSTPRTESQVPPLPLRGRPASGTRFQPQRLRGTSGRAGERPGNSHDYLLRTRPFLRIKREERSARPHRSERQSPAPNSVLRFAPAASPLPTYLCSRPISEARPTRHAGGTSTRACVRKRAPTLARGGPAFPTRPRRPLLLLSSGNRGSRHPRALCGYGGPWEPVQESQAEQ